jgi:hypothetical protein
MEKTADNGRLVRYAAAAWEAWNALRLSLHFAPTIQKSLSLIPHFFLNFQMFTLATISNKNQGDR